MREKKPQAGGHQAEADQSQNMRTLNMNKSTYTRANPPAFPSGGKLDHHTRAALAMLLRGGAVDQYRYAASTGYPATDFRTRISELYLAGWPIDRKFHIGLDHERIPRRCKEYWLNRERLRDLYAQHPDFLKRCRAFRKEVAHA